MISGNTIIFNILFLFGGILETNITGNIFFSIQTF